MNQFIFKQFFIFILSTSFSHQKETKTSMSEKEIKSERLHCSTFDKRKDINIDFWVFPKSIKIKIIDSLKREYNCKGSSYFLNKLNSRDPHMEVKSTYLEPCSPRLSKELDQIIRSKIEYSYNVVTGASRLRWKAREFPSDCQIHLNRLDKFLL